MNCKIIRRKLVTFGIVSIVNGEHTKKGQQWITEECGTPIFGNKKKPVCSSCIKGWTHKNNYMLENEENNKLINL